MARNRKRYRVYWDGELALEVTDAPGPLISRAAPPPSPGTEPATHPFLTATAHLPQHETTLREVLDRSASLADYLGALRSMGFVVIKTVE
jgi:hypothetical protein